MLNSFFIPESVGLEEVFLPAFQQAGVSLAILRLDKTDTFISGNKWFKLHYHLEKAKELGAKGLISVGGRHSNHLHALAVAGKKHGFKTVGLVRGEPKQTGTTEDLERFDMDIHWLTYSDYRRRYQDVFWQEWLVHYPDYYCIPEGGGGILGAKGCAIIPHLIEHYLSNIGWSDYDQLFVSVGTGSTLAGILWGDQGQHVITGCLAVPTRYGVDQQLAELLATMPVMNNNYRLWDVSRRGFGKMDGELKEYIQKMDLLGVMLDPVYTAKSLYFIEQQIQAGVIRKGEKIVFVHTGGLQGRRFYQQTDDISY